MDFEKLQEILADEKYYAKHNFVPIIRDKSAKYLYDFVKENNIKNVLEIGTAIGYSGSIIVSAGAERLATVDINPDYIEMAKNTFSKVGILDKVDIICGDAKDIIVDLKNQNKKFDMIFLDGAKGQYIAYLDTLSQLLGKNAVIFADNVLLSGMVESVEEIPHKKRTMVVNLRKYLKRVFEKPYLTKLVRIEDGIAITKYEGE